MRISKIEKTLIFLILIMFAYGFCSANTIDSVGISDKGKAGNLLVITTETPIPSDEPFVFSSDHTIELAFPNTDLAPTISQSTRLINEGNIVSLSIKNEAEQAKSTVTIALKEKQSYSVSRSGSLLLLHLDAPIKAEPVKPVTPASKKTKVVVKKVDQRITVKAKALPHANKALQETSKPLKVTKKPASVKPVISPSKLKRSKRALPKAPSLPKKNIVKDDLNVVPFTLHRSSKGGALLRVKLTNTHINVTKSRKKGHILLSVKRGGLTGKGRHEYDVMDFGTPINRITRYQAKGQDWLDLKLKPHSHNEVSVAASGDKYTLMVTPKKKKKKDDSAVFLSGAKYTGDKVTLDFQSIEVRAVLQLLADFTKLNLIVSDTVKGSITLRLKNVPWDQAFDLILKTKGLGMRQDGNVIRVAPVNEIALREKQELASKKQAIQLEDIESMLIEINYAKVTDIEEVIKNSKPGASSTSNSGSDTVGFLSDRGQITIDKRTNSMIVWDTKKRLMKIRKLIGMLDKPVKQVLIESRIVIANQDFSKELGARFGFSANKQLGNSFSTTLSGTLGDITRSGSVISSSGNVGSSSNVSSISANQGLAVNLPVASPAGSIGLALARLPAGDLLQLELSAMQSEGRGEIISNPKVITSNKKKATIHQGTEIPYQQASSSGATAVAFKEALLQLDVTPQITPDGRIIMDLKVDKDSVGTIFNGIPSINTQGVETQVLVKNGETIVLGGILEEVKLNNTTKVPFFGDLPYVGRLFQNKSHSNSKKELLIFVTPKILTDSLIN